MKKIVTVISAFENDDIINFTISAPKKFSEKVIIVDGIRPIIRRKPPQIKWDEIRKVPYSLDEMPNIIEAAGCIYIRPNAPLYNGEKIEIGKKYCEQHNIDYDCLLYLESDEVIEPEDIDNLIRYVNDNNAEFMCFELIQLWKDYTGYFVAPSCSKIQCDMSYHFNRRDEGHNAIHIRDLANKFMVEDVRLYHLHAYRKNGLARVNNGIWYGGGDNGGIHIDKIKFDLDHTPFLDKIYAKLQIQELERDDIIRPIDDESNTYIGMVYEEDDFSSTSG